MTSLPEIQELSEEDIVRRYSKRMSGYRLISYDQVATPLFRLQVRILQIVQKKLPAIPEFVLRAVETGLVYPSDIAGFLGLEAAVVNKTLTELMSGEHIVLIGVEQDRHHRLALTEKGKGTLTGLQLEVPEQVTVTIVFDGLTRRIIDERGFEPIPPAQLKKIGRTEISPYPRTRPTVEEFREEFFQKRETQESSFDLIEIIDVQKCDPVFRDDVFLLVFQSDSVSDDRNTPSEPQVGFVVGGHWSEEHADAFRRSSSNSQFSLIPKYLPNENEIIASVVPPDIMKDMAPSEETASLREQSERAEERIVSVQKKLETTSSASERSILIEQLRDEQARRAEAEARLSSIPVRQVEVYEHPKIMNTALDDAEDRLMIISPWINGSVVNHRFLKKLEDALYENVYVYIGYGIGEDDKQDMNAIRNLENLEKKYDNFFLKRLGDTHAKILICDTKYAVTTSFNWLSFRGDPHRTFRDERGCYVGIENYVKGLFDSYKKRF